MYYYETNLQGDVIGIKDSSGQRIVAYAYDAWGKVQIVQRHQIDIINPLLYRGYVYDWETGLYYLQSRYYNPQWGRFINSDTFYSTGQGFTGNNMFAYCGNNPVNRIDTDGASWTEFWNNLTHSFQGAVEYFAAAAAVSQADSPALGVADVVAVGMLIGGVVYCGGQAIRNTLKFDQYNSSILSPSTEDDLSGIARSYGNFMCVDAANAMADYLRKNGKNAEFITISFVGMRSYIWCNSKEKIISENGIHIGILYEGNVYCNIHPFGLPEMLWIDDFEGTGQRIITKTPI